MMAKKNAELSSKTKGSVVDAAPQNAPSTLGHDNNLLASLLTGIEKFNQKKIEQVAKQYCDYCIHALTWIEVIGALLQLMNNAFTSNDESRGKSTANSKNIYRQVCELLNEYVKNHPTAQKALLFNHDELNQSELRSGYETLADSLLRSIQLLFSEQPDQPEALIALLQSIRDQFNSLLAPAVFPMRSGLAGATAALAPKTIQKVLQRLQSPLDDDDVYETRQLAANLADALIGLLEPAATTDETPHALFSAIAADPPGSYARKQLLSLMAATTASGTRLSEDVATDVREDIFAPQFFSELLLQSHELLSALLEENDPITTKELPLYQVFESGSATEVSDILHILSSAVVDMADHPDWQVAAGRGKSSLIGRRLVSDQLFSKYKVFLKQCLTQSPYKQLPQYKKDLLTNLLNKEISSIEKRKTERDKRTITPEVFLLQRLGGTKEKIEANIDTFKVLVHTTVAKCIQEAKSIMRPVDNVLHEVEFGVASFAQKLGVRSISFYINQGTVWFAVGMGQDQHRTLIQGHTQNGIEPSYDAVVFHERFQHQATEAILKLVVTATLLDLTRVMRSQSLSLSRKARKAFTPSSSKKIKPTLMRIPRCRTQSDRQIHQQADNSRVTARERSEATGSGSPELQIVSSHWKQRVGAKRYVAAVKAYNKAKQAGVSESELLGLEKEVDLSREKLEKIGEDQLRTMESLSDYERHGLEYIPDPVLGEDVQITRYIGRYTRPPLPANLSIDTLSAHTIHVKTGVQAQTPSQRYTTSGKVILFVVEGLLNS